MKNVFEATDARRKWAKTRSVREVNEHFEPIFNEAAATQIVFQQPVKGFTLLEMAVVMVILGLLLGGLLVPLTTQRDNNNRKATEQQLLEIHDALIGFASANGRLPCPANAGSAGLAAPNAATTNCATPHGFVPARSLGLNGVFDGNNYLLDAWNNPLRYSLSTASGGAFPNNITLTDVADLRVCAQSACTTILASNLVAVIYSRGKDGAQATVSVDQLENTDADTDFVSRTPSAATNAEFDDALFWLSPNSLTFHLVKAGQLP